MCDCVKMRWLIFMLAVTYGSALKLHSKDPCDVKECRAGRECVVVEGLAECLCVVSCPDHFKPICGNDGVSYDNHCKLHQRACMAEQHISIKHKGFCKKSVAKLWKKDRKTSLLSKADLEDELQNDIIKGLRKNEKEQPQRKEKGPAVCYGVQRNALRFLLVQHWEEDMKTQPWHVEGMTYRESLWGWFFSCDTDKDNFLTPKELLTCAKDVDFFARPGQDNELTKALCIDAVVDDGDLNQDWRLDFEEFTRVMNSKYQPRDKKCSLGGKTYVDGGEVHVECNFCVCAVGNWVCASTNCAETPARKKEQRRTHTVAHTELDNTIDESSSLVKAVPVVDLWEEEIHKSKKKVKQQQKKKKEEEEEVFDVIDDNDPFLDFDDEVMQTADDDKTPKENYDLKMDEYYDDLLEKTKAKHHKKRKFQLEKALKEVRMLQKKTEQLKNLLVRRKNEKSEKKTQTKRKEYQFPRKETKKTRRNEVDLQRKEIPTVKTAYYEDIFKKTNWNDLLDWGNLKKYKKRTFDNTP